MLHVTLKSLHSSVRKKSFVGMGEPMGAAWRTGGVESSLRHPPAVDAVRRGHGDVPQATGRLAWSSGARSAWTCNFGGLHTTDL